ncbi:hypothetical protein EC973_008223 [Apophysomyces ossiformis]|uniref:Association with the SNF1 complex (ASC) domain-containing protein n=1 Tax=Apophysomyces ossiformis TaxID=679940 RepID=A0A8H7ER54_9FUNG|nr:hypothetical protein EC973_008223 [Apophysomyces ossiformis]
MGNSASTEHSNISASLNAQRQNTDSAESSQSYAHTADKSNTRSAQKKNADRAPFRLSVTEPMEREGEVNTTESTTPTDLSPDLPVYGETTAWIPREVAAGNSEQPAPRAVPVSTGKSGWVSSTGAVSPWVGSSLSSSASSNHRDSIRGPYYRARGMSIHRDSEIEEDITQHQIVKSPVYESKGIKSKQKKYQVMFTMKNLYLYMATGVPTLITWTQGGQNVYVTGTFNGWKHKIKLVKSTQDFNAVLELPHGTHRLKFIVDDEWKCSNDLETATDPDGNLVNYLQVMDEDEELMSEPDMTGGKDESDTSTASDHYSSEIPADLLALAAVATSNENEEEAKRAVTEWERRQAQPPSLPPHLEKVLLNSQNVSEEDNSVLPEPNHVTLNHLYACSIKDNVMALSTTTRYRKKYVTTMYYRPVVPKR